MLKIAPALLLFLTVFSCSKRTADSSQTTEPTNKTYDPAELFEYELPTGWFVKTEHGTPAKLVLMDTTNNSSINVQTDYPALTEFNIDTTLSELRTLYPDIDIFEHRQFEVNKQFAYQINFGIGRNEYMNFSTVGVRSDKFLAIFTLTCQKENYQSGLNSLNELLNSVALK